MADIFPKKVSRLQRAFSDVVALRNNTPCFRFASADFEHTPTMTVTAIMFLQATSAAIMRTISKFVAGDCIDMLTDNTEMLFCFAVIAGCCAHALSAFLAMRRAKPLAIKVEPTPVYTLVVDELKSHFAKSDLRAGEDSCGTGTALLSPVSSHHTPKPMQNNAQAASVPLPPMKITPPSAAPVRLPLKKMTLPVTLLPMKMTRPFVATPIPLLPMKMTPPFAAPVTLLPMKMTLPPPMKMTPPVTLLPMKMTPSFATPVKFPSLESMPHSATISFARSKGLVAFVPSPEIMAKYAKVMSELKLRF